MSEKIIWHKISDKLVDYNFFIPKNEVRIIEANGKNFCVGHLEDGFYAISNSCPHASGPLGDGWLDGKGNVVCPHHRYKYNLKTGSNTSGEGYYVKPYTIIEKEDGLYIGIPEKNWFSLW